MKIGIDPLRQDKYSMSQKLLDPKILHIIYSLKCNIKCRHCHNDSGAAKKEMLDIDKIIKLIQSAAGTSIERVVLLGGEIFLFPDIIESVIKESHRNNLAVTLVSNGFWGKSIDAVNSVISLLRLAEWDPSNDNMICSIGDYHQEWLPLDSVKTAVTEYYSAFKQPIRLQVECVTTTIEEYKILFSDIDAASFRFSSVISGVNLYRFGRDEPIKIDENDIRDYKEITGCDKMSRIMVAATGQIFPCCGFNDNNPGLSFDNLNYSTDGVNQLIKRANDSPMVKLLMNNELREVYSVLVSTHPDLPTKFAHRCEMCEIVCDQKYRREVRNAFPNI